MKGELFCHQCSSKFSIALARFNTSFAFDLHVSNAHKVIEELKVDLKVQLSPSIDNQNVRERSYSEDEEK